VRSAAVGELLGVAESGTAADSTQVEALKSELLTVRAELALLRRRTNKYVDSHPLTGAGSFGSPGAPGAGGPETKGPADASSGVADSEKGSDVVTMNSMYKGFVGQVRAQLQLGSLPTNYVLPVLVSSPSPSLPCAWGRLRAR
jgi:hypothetical protein